MLVSVLRQYLNKEVGFQVISRKVDPMLLTAVEEDYLTLTCGNKRHHIPYPSIVQVVEDSLVYSERKRLFIQRKSFSLLIVVGGLPFLVS